MARSGVAGVDPAAVPIVSRGVIAFNVAGGVVVDPSLPWIYVYNSDAVNHKVTATVRHPPGVSQDEVTAVPFTLTPGQIIPVPTSIFNLLVDAQANGNCFAWYSDVPLSGPSGAAGSGTAITPNPTTLTTYTPNATGSVKMAGLGNTGLAITPLKSGKVRISFHGIGLVKASCLVTLRAYTGTLPAPNQNDAATGTARGTNVLLDNQHLASNENLNASFAVIVTGLTVGTRIWADLGVELNTGADATSAITVVAAIEELAN